MKTSAEVSTINKQPLPDKLNSDAVAANKQTSTQHTGANNAVWIHVDRNRRDVDRLEREKVSQVRLPPLPPPDQQITQFRKEFSSHSRVFGYLHYRPNTYNIQRYWVFIVNRVDGN